MVVTPTHNGRPGAHYSPNNQSEGIGEPRHCYSADAWRGGSSNPSLPRGKLGLGELCRCAADMNHNRQDTEGESPMVSCREVACHRSDRLTNRDLLLSTYLPRMTIRYQKGASHDNVNTLSRSRNLQCDPGEIRRRFPRTSGRSVCVTSTSDVGMTLSDEINI
ncbi:hypothetical protein AJ78_05043 [Emergomyces pasteurianus Ep9510]|uniref:Uncharacterized protein n=1 Tax=Emergomyces pasteurianus Ep9510 TaxID=1447872 RepID=A0A1J9QHD0_9EURO|nr:hypothetical protein AJ78_05043 [Emergomyces pasteurianus Ep9510]